VARADVAGAQPAPVVAPAGPGQPALAVGVGQGVLLSKVCPSATGCTPAGGASLAAPAEVAAKLGAARATVVRLAGGRHLVRVDVDADNGASWVALLAAPPAKEAASGPRQLWSGVVSAPRGQHGEGKSRVVLQEKAGDGERVIVGERWDEVTICGRPTVVNARRVEPATMTLERGVQLDNLTAADRKQAVRVSAAAGSAEGRAPWAVLRATAASSAVERNFAALTDGDPATAWSENRPGDGRGEFVTMSAASEVGIEGFEITVRPSKEVVGGAAPKRAYLATDDRLFEVTFPEDAWQKPVARWDVALPAPVRTSCVALVLDEAFGGRAESARVTVAEVRARTPFDASTPDALVGALAGGGERARAAAALLARGGAAAVTAAISGYERLDDAGKMLALDVIDTGSCQSHARFFGDLLAARADAGKPSRDRSFHETRTLAQSELLHARDRLRRCGRAAAEVLARVVAEGTGPARSLAAAELPLVAPAESVSVLLDAMAKADDAGRRELRAALSLAAKSARAWPAFTAELEASRRATRGPVLEIDLFRALGAYIERVEGSAQAFAAVARQQRDFRARYLLLGPAAELARAGDRAALAWLGLSLRTDGDAHVRARAAEVSARVPELLPHLAVAAEDGEVRVRQAAANSIGVIAANGDGRSGGAKTTAAARDALVRRLRLDPWTFVRSGAARSLGALPADAGADRSLAAAMGDASPEVRMAAIDALGEHRAAAYAPAIRELMADSAQPGDVRVSAVLALATMCDRQSIDAWTKMAHRVANPQGEQDLRLGVAAVAALGRLHPADLSARLAPVNVKGVPASLRDLVRAAVNGKGACAR
jgi:hypothetical protein